MHFLPCLLASAVAAADTSPPAPLVRSEAVLVRAVISGDTLDVAAVGRVPLLGIDAPAMGRGSRLPAPFAREARDRLASLVMNRWVRLEREPGGSRARRAAYVMTEEGTFVNATLVREGLARVAARGQVSRSAELQRAESEAKASARGLWGRPPLASTGVGRATPRLYRFRAAPPGVAKRKRARAGKSRSRPGSIAGTPHRDGPDRGLEMEHVRRLSKTRTAPPRHGIVIVVFGQPYARTGWVAAEDAGPPDNLLDRVRHCASR